MEELEAAIAKMNPAKPLARMLFLAAWSNTLEILQKKNYWKFLTFHGLLANCPNLKLSTVIPILKPNKNASECNNYRPISSPAPSASSWNGLSTVGL
ncbi:hypothetical protein TNCV_751061 [Trichonephila clavipes]|nr:hypothetical protein TNCV_751061 [Trichonephila clavipes]